MDEPTVGCEPRRRVGPPTHLSCSSKGQGDTTLLSLAPHHLWQVGKQASGSRGWKSCPCPSPRQQRRADPVVRSTGEPALGLCWPHTPCRPCGGKGKEKDALPPTSLCYLQQVREPILPLTSCSTLNSKACTSPGHYSRVAPTDGGMGVPDPKMSMRELTLPLIYPIMEWIRKRSPPRPSLTVAGGRASPEVMRARELSLPLTTCST